MAFPAYWSPHNAAFLNWRYLDHPTEQYVGFALVENDRPVAYSVLRTDGREATLSEFAADTASEGHAIKLLEATIRAAREAGCAYMTFFGTPVWRHWGLFRRAGLVRYQTKNFLDATYKVDEKNSQRIESWQLTPGDRDYH
jgi:GNAT superfamily N-acetyltransferase